MAGKQRRAALALSLLSAVFFAAVTSETVEVADSSNNNNNAIVKPEVKSTTKSTLAFVNPLKNYSKFEGDALKLKCEVTGSPPATEFRWFKNEAPLAEEKGRIKVKDNVGSGEGGEGTRWSRIRFRDLEIMDMGYYRCEASNGLTTVQSEAIIQISTASKWTGRNDHRDWYDGDDNDYDGRSSSSFVGNQKCGGSARQHESGSTAVVGYGLDTAADLSVWVQLP